MFNEQKVAQMAAYFLNQMTTKRLYLIKLMKLLYLADREAMKKYGFPISGDHMVSMNHGPVLSRTYELMNGATKPNPKGWEGWVSDRENHRLALRKDIDASRSNLDKLSDAEIEVLDSVWNEFGHMLKWDLVDYTHDNCPEWSNPHDSSTPINYKDILKAVGKTDDEAEYYTCRMHNEKQLDNIFASL